MSGDAAVALARRYLTLCSAGRPDEAAALLAPGASIVFPGCRAYSGPAEQAAHARELYRSVRKDIDCAEAFPAAADERWCVILSGTLSGQALDGTAFDGVRFLDRFAVHGDRIVEQHVFNDLAALGVVAPQPGCDDQR